MAESAIQSARVRQEGFAGGDSGRAALLARMAAVLGAQRAVQRRDVGAEYALRQSLVDLAAAAELVAEELPSL